MKKRNRKKLKKIKGLLQVLIIVWPIKSLVIHIEPSRNFFVESIQPCFCKSENNAS